MATNQREIERGLQGPRGKKYFGRGWLQGLPDDVYRNYMCRAFAYCQIKERFQGEPSEAVRQGLKCDLQQVIEGRIEPQLPAAQRLKAYFENHRFYIEKKAGSKTFKRYVTINAPQLKLQYFNKEDGGKAKGKTYSIKDIRFERAEQNGVQILRIQPIERPKGPLILSSDKNKNIAQVYSNISALQQNPETSNRLERFLRVYNYSIIKRLMIRFMEVQKFMRENVMIRKYTAQDMKLLNSETLQQAQKVSVKIISEAFKAWLKEDPIHPPHFISEFKIQDKQQLHRELMILDTNGSMKDVEFARGQKFDLESVKFREYLFGRGKFVQQHPQALQAAVQKVDQQKQGKVSFKQILNQEVNPQKPPPLMLQTLPYGEISSIVINSQQDKNIIKIFGRRFISKKARITELLDPGDYGYYNNLTSSQQKIDILTIGVRDIRVSNVQHASAYQYYLYVSVERRRKVLIKGSIPLIDQKLQVNLQFPIRLNPGEQHISLILTRKTSETSREQNICFDQGIPFNPNQNKISDTLLKPQNGKYKVIMNYFFREGNFGNQTTIDNFSQNLVPGSVVGYRSEDSNCLECGMIIGMNFQGTHVILQPAQSNKFSLETKPYWNEKYHKILIDVDQIEYLEGRFHCPTYWLDRYKEYSSHSVLDKSNGGQASHQWFISFEFTFPIELTIALNQIQRRYKMLKMEEYKNFLNMLDKFHSIDGIAIQLSLMGTIEIQVLSCSNVLQYKSGDKYKIQGDVFTENQDYQYNDEIQNDDYVRAFKSMEAWKNGTKEKPQTNDGEAKKQSVNINHMIQWNSQFDRRLDFGLFQQDVTQKKIIRLSLIRQRGNQIKPIRAVELRVEDLMDLNSPLKLRYLHLKQPKDAHERNIVMQQKNLTTECLQVMFMFFPVMQSIEQQRLNPSYYADKNSLLHLMREKRRMQLDYQDDYQNLVPFGEYDPNILNKFFNHKFYQERIKDDIQQGGSNTIKDAFFPQSTQVNLMQSIEKREKMIRPVMQQATFHMAQARIYEVSQQQSLFYQSYGYQQYLQLHLLQAQKQNKEPTKPKRNPCSSVIDQDNQEIKNTIPVFAAQDPDLTIDLDMRYEQQNTDQFQTMMGLIKRGIPKMYREKLWFSLLKVKKHVEEIKQRNKIKNQDIFFHYLEKADQNRSNLLQLIDYDLARFQKFPISSNIPPPKTSQGIRKMREYSQVADRDRTARDQNIKGVVRKVLRAYAVWIEDENKQIGEKKNQKSYIYHRGLIWIVYRLVHGGIVSSLSTAFKILIGLAKNLELIFQRNQKTLLLNELQTQKATFSNILLEDFMLRIRANIDVMYPELTRKIKNYGYPIEYYIGQKFLSLFSDSTMSSEHIYLIWDWVIFYSALEEDNSRFSDVLPLAITLFFFQNIVEKKFVDKIQTAQEIKYLIDNPFLFDVENLNTINFSQKVLTIYRSLFSGNMVSNLIGREGKIERAYDELHANYKKEFLKNFYHNEFMIKSITKTENNPKVEPLSRESYINQIDQFLNHLINIQSGQEKHLRVTIVDIRILKEYVEQAFNKGIPADATFTIGVQYGDHQRMKYILLPNTLGKYHGQVFKFPIRDTDDTLKILLFINKELERNRPDDSIQQISTRDSPTKKNKRIFLEHNQRREIDASSIDAKLQEARTD